MIAACMIVKIVTLSTATFHAPNEPTYPRFLWGTLWITMFTNLKGRTNRALHHGASPARTRATPRGTPHQEVQP